MREKLKKTAGSVFSKEQHPAAQTSSSFQKEDEVFMKRVSFCASRKTKHW